MIGRTIAHYKIVEKLGEGGMGVVYRAEDTHLDRAVALKILPAEAVANPERKRRFVQEAKAASALSHPNIVTIYDIDTADGVNFIAMEFVPGKTLDQVVGRRGLGRSEVLKYAIQIADALAKAHAAGIVHRDLKPGNIMVMPEGSVKLLDFGLAKLAERVEEDEMTVTMDRAPKTEEGTIVGTVAYMSPEQAQGHKVDARSDIFSFGTVLYEMVTGRRTFQRESRISTLSAILHEDPKPISEETDPGLQELEKIIGRCLRKDPGRRLQHMDDVKTLLEDLKEESESGRLPAAAPKARRSRAPLVGAVAVLVLTTAAVTWWLARSRTPAPATELSTLTRLTSDSGFTGDPVLSPDGKLLAYASDRAGNGDLDIWVQQIGGGGVLRLTQHEADDREPSFSPDGNSIAFRSERDGGGVYVVPSLGGEERRIARAGRQPRFSPDGSLIAYWTGENTTVPAKLYVVPVAGGTPRQLQPDFFIALNPTWSPDGKHILFGGLRAASVRGADWDWWVTPLDDGEAVRTGARAALSSGSSAVQTQQRTPAVWASRPDRVIFSAQRGDTLNLWQALISPGTWQVSGPAQRLTFGAGADGDPSVAGGRLAFSISTQNVDVWSLPVDANRGKATGELQRVTRHPALDARPSISADGSRLVYLTLRGEKPAVWMQDLKSGKESIVVENTAYAATTPKISPDGTRVAYAAFENQKEGIYVVSAAGGDAERLCQDCRLPTSWSSDGKQLLYEAANTSALVLVDVTSRQRTDIIKHPTYGVSQGRISPDNHWLSFHTVQGPASRRIFVAPFKGAAAIPESEWIPITDGSDMDRYAAWSPNGNLLYFLTEREGFRCIWAQRLDPFTKRPSGEAFAVQDFHHANLSLLSPGDPIGVGLSVARDRIVFSLSEITGNVWMTSIEGR